MKRWKGTWRNPCSVRKELLQPEPLSTGEGCGLATAEILTPAPAIYTRNQTCVLNTFQHNLLATISRLELGGMDHAVYAKVSRQFGLVVSVMTTNSH